MRHHYLECTCLGDQKQPVSDGDTVKRKPSSPICGTEFDSASMAINVETSLKTRYRTSMVPSDPTSWQLSQEHKSTMQKDTHTYPYVNHSAVCNSQDPETTQVPENR